MSMPTITRLPDIEADVVIDYNDLLGFGPADYGTNGWWTDEDANLWHARYAELAPQIVRVLVVHDFLEPVNDDDDPGNINWAGFQFDTPMPWFGRSVTYRRWFEALRDNNVAVMVYVPYLAGWLSTNGDEGIFSTYPPISVLEYQEFIIALLHYLIDEVGFSPEHVVLEPVNEPDLGCGQDRSVPCFWKNWHMEQLVAVVKAGSEAARLVSPDIRVFGLSECCGTELVYSFIEEYAGEDYLDGVTYHQYVTSFRLEQAIEKARRIEIFGKPIYINEYGHKNIRSNGTKGAVWNSYALSLLWANNVNALQFPFSEFKGVPNEYSEMGLFGDWEADWALKPAYWVYVHFFRRFSGAQRVAASGDLEIPAIAARKVDQNGEERLSIWITNPRPDPLSSFRIRVDGVLPNVIAVEAYNNFHADDQIASISTVENGTSLLIKTEILGESSYSFDLIIAP
jgi:hypothetical protein